MGNSFKPSILLIFLILFGLATSCMPEAPRSLASNSSNADGSTDDDEIEEVITDALHWYTQGTKTQTITLNSNNQNTAYIRGTEVQNFLSSTTNFSKNYCVVVKFIQNSYQPKEYRFKVVPALTTNYATNKTEYFYRTNINSADGNNICNLNIIDNAGNITTPGTVANEASLICPTCLNIFQSESVKLYQITTDSFGSQYLTQVENSFIPMVNLVMRVNQNNDSNNPGGSCSDSSCRAQGYNCCIEGQCVNDKAIKGGVDQSSPEFQAIHLQRLTNPNWYLNYPDYYYACTIAPSTTGGGGDPEEPTNPIDDAAALLEKMNKDYLCIEELKLNSNNDPFHLEPYNGNPSNYTACNVTDSANDLFYETVMKRMYAQCGCSQTTLSDMVEHCPKYTYKQVYENNQLARIECVTPQPDNGQLPFQDLEVSVNSRTAPHRFFNTDGDEINLSNTPSGNITSEGEIFQYLDDAKVFPNNGAFNMNSILGQIDVSLTGAHPAKIIDIEYDKTYFIGASQGMYTACPECGKDSWFANFTAFPITTYGTGLQATGYTTKRAEWGTNSKLGNYEDTIFGRACFVPPTMLPFSHDDYSNSQLQRQNRLKTQAFMYVNGYQRDWYGFNKGALIGSFDGVSWFAIGKGRTAKATTNKLYLAINAPFADLAGNNQHVVTVQEYDFISTAANKDYDMDLSPQDSRQNEAGSCQYWHQCNADTDCITKLGWEYSCVDVTQYRTQWPDFNVEGAGEKSTTSRIGTIADFLNQEGLSGDTKRCVYRGAGSPCQANYAQITDESKRKALTCAPNFYCATLDTNDAVFNTEVARYASPLENLIEPKNHFFGQDALVLGRPKHYVTGSSLTNLNNANYSAIKANLKENISQMTTSSNTQFGICRPGKSLPTYTSVSTSGNTRKQDQHQTKDSSSRTDFISQIAGCNSSLYLSSRYASCPILDENGNYVDTQSDYLSDAFTYKNESTTMSQSLATLRLGTNQNSCGLESLAPGTPIGYGVNTDTIWQSSALKNVEARTLASSDTVTEPKFARDACFRRAGSVCHTDYDCSPNKLIAEQVDLMNPSFFGNLAELIYHQEYLVCGQAKPEPTFGSGEYYDYDMSQNRCCREVGKTLTLYTEDTPNLPESQGLRTDLFGSYNPTNTKRYSRYANVEKAVTSSTSLGGIVRPSANTANAGSTTQPNILSPNQWRTISESAGKTCCGGGWVRKFADGSNNWSKTDRLTLEVENFRCINYNHPLMNSNIENPQANFGITRSKLDQDRVDFCVDPTVTAAGCAQQDIHSTGDLNSSIQPVIHDSSFISQIYTLPDWDGWSDPENLWSLHPLKSVDSNSSTYLDWDKAKDDVLRNNIRVYIPAWLPLETIRAYNPDPLLTGVTLDTQPDGNPESCVPTTYATAITSSTDVNPSELDPSRCSFELNTVTRIITIFPARTYFNGAIPDGDLYEKKPLGARIRYTAPGTYDWELAKAPNTTTPSPHRRGSTPGDYLYYLKRLGKLEYLGIPQMTYEPIYCNTNYQEVVPGIFADAVKTVHDFINNPNTFIDTNAQKPWRTDTPPSSAGPNQVISADAAGLNTRHVASSELVNHSAVFSPNEFMCCSKLGQEVADYNQCCTGYAVENEGGNPSYPYICKLPPGSDLTVYFNRFVSGEGVGSDLPVEAFTNSDFDEKTGEPRLTTAVLQKLSAFGAEYCSSGRTRRGGAFGDFPAEPFGTAGQQNGGSELFGIVDSATDLGQGGQVETGYTKFYEGFRWNHHIYCDFE